MPREHPSIKELPKLHSGQHDYDRTGNRAESND
jgi:hypothetical protein